MKIGKTIYLDHQATTPVDPVVLKAMLPYFSETFGNPHSSEHALGWSAAQVVDRVQAEVSKLICAEPDEIIFTSGATESNNLALHGLVKKSKNKKRHRIIVSSIEHKSIIELVRMINIYYDYNVELIPVDSCGVVRLDKLDELLDDNVLLVSIMAVNNEIGTIQPLTEIGSLVKKYGAYFHCDAAQAPCVVDIDVVAMNIDLLSLSGHKIYGPKGIGSLYVKREVQSNLEPVIYGGGQQNNLRSGTVPVPLCVGFGAACSLLSRPETPSERNSLAQLRDKFVSKLITLNANLTLNGPALQKRHSGNANLCFNGYTAQDILLALQPLVAASSGSACTSGITETSYVLRAIGLTEEAAASSIRFSLGRFTTEEDVDSAVGIINNVLSRMG